VLWPKEIISKIMDQYENMFGCKPKEYTALLEKGDHPEIDDTDKLDIEGIKKKMMMGVYSGLFCSGGLTSKQQ
jgi:hypothetical protein